MFCPRHQPSPHHRRVARDATFYIYCHLIGERLKDMGLTFEQFAELHHVHARKIEFLWDGIGE